MVNSVDKTMNTVMTTMKRAPGYAMAVALAAMLAAAPTALAQETEDEDDADAASEIVIEVDEQGRLVVDGEPVSDETGRVVVRIEPGSGIDVDRRRGRVYVSGRSRVHRPGALGRREDVVVRPFDVRTRIDHLRPFMADFELRDIPPLDRVLGDFEFAWEENFGARLEEHSEVAELERESRRLARDARRAESGAREELEGELRAQLEEIFDRKMELRQERIARVEERLAEMRAEYDARTNERETIIDRRQQYLLGESDELEW